MTRKAKHDAGARRIALGAVAAALLAASTPAGADEARLTQGLEEACLAIGGEALFIPWRLSERFYWTGRQAPSILDFNMIRDDTQVFLTVGDRTSCVVTDMRVPPSAALIEAALERRFPGGWSAGGGVWTVGGEAPLTVRLTETAYGPGIAVETGS